MTESATGDEIVASVVVCTYRRLALLASCLRGCAVQVLEPGFRFEVLVVDNDCSAEVADLVVSLSDACAAWDLRYIPQPVLGLTHSRNAGVEHARGEVVVFLDDDAVPVGTGWLAALLARLRDPAVGAVGGQVVPDFGELPRPAWLSRHLEAKYTILPIPRAAPAGAIRRGFPFRSRVLPVGANLAIRAELIVAFDDRTSRTGAGLISRDELPVLRAVEARGGSVWLDPAATVLHRIPAERLTKEWVCRRFAAEGASRLPDRLASGAPEARSALACLGHAALTATLAALILPTKGPGRVLAFRCRMIEAGSEFRSAVSALVARRGR